MDRKIQREGSLVRPTNELIKAEGMPFISRKAACTLSPASDVGTPLCVEQREQNGFHPGQAVADVLLQLQEASSGGFQQSPFVIGHVTIRADHHGRSMTELGLKARLRRDGCDFAE